MESHIRREIRDIDIGNEVASGGVGVRDVEDVGRSREAQRYRHRIASIAPEELHSGVGWQWFGAWIGQGVLYLPCVNNLLGPTLEYVVPHGMPILPIF